MKDCLCSLTGVAHQTRLKIVLGLAVELEKIRQQSNFMLGMGEEVIARVIKGDWGAVLRFVGILQEHPNELPLWGRFVALLQAAIVDARLRPAMSEFGPH